MRSNNKPRRARRTRRFFIDFRVLRVLRGLYLLVWYNRQNRISIIWKLTAMEKVNVANKLSLFNDHWSPKIAAELNGQYVKLVKFQGEFVWHHHENEDELFLVIK